MGPWAGCSRSSRQSSPARGTRAGRVSGGKRPAGSGAAGGRPGRPRRAGQVGSRVVRLSILLFVRRPSNCQAVQPPFDSKSHVTQSSPPLSPPIFPALVLSPRPSRLPGITPVCAPLQHGERVATPSSAVSPFPCLDCPLRLPGACLRSPIWIAADVAFLPFDTPTRPSLDRPPPRRLVMLSPRLHPVV